MQPGERVAGRFEILGEAARGGMGTVFRAFDRRDRRDVALKVLRTAAADQLARFAREAEILAGLGHPNIVEYISHGATPHGVHYLVMAWVDGETLGHRLAHAGIAGGDAIAIAIQLCRALAALHERGVVHRDIKPSNIMLIGDARAVVVDLGIARRAGEAGLTRTGAVVGTAGYLAPEQVRCTAEIDGRADLFALGCVLHECFAGSPAFTGDTTAAVRARVLLHDPPALRALDPSLPPTLDALVSALLARNPAQRPASAAAVEQALCAIGPLPAAQRRVARDAAPTISAPGPARAIARNLGPLCGILIGCPGDVPDLPEDAIVVERFDGGAAVVLAGEPAAAARRALALAAAMPGAAIVVAPGQSTDECLDHCARLLAQLAIAVRISGDAITGVWIERSAGERLTADFRIAASAGHLRIAGEAT